MRVRLALPGLVALLAAGCGGTVVGPTENGRVVTPPKGNPAAGKVVFLRNACGGCHTFTPAGTTAIPDERDADDVRHVALRPAGLRPRRIPDRALRLPPAFPRDVDVVATDLDHTLTWEGPLAPRTLAALARARDAGLRVIVVTGRMVQSLRRVLAPAGLHEPVVCYQGAVVVAPGGEWLLHRPIAPDLAREAIAAVEEAGYHPNVYVGDELYVSRLTPGSEAYATFQQIPIHTVGDVKAWLPGPPTKIVCVGDPDELDRLGARMRARFDGRLWVTKSLPKFLEFATVGVSKGSALEFLSRRYGFSRERTIAFGDGENDVELVEWAGYGIAVENAHERVKAVADWICPPAAEEGVARVLEALLDSRA